MRDIRTRAAGKGNAGGPPDLRGGVMHRLVVTHVGTDKIEEDAAQRALPAAIRHQHAAVRFCFERLGDECVRPLWAKRTNGAPDRGACPGVRFAKLGGDLGGGICNEIGSSHTLML